MKTAVMYGAGNIGRGFIGQVFSDSGYEVCFLDIDEAIVDEINRRRRYTVRAVTDERAEDREVGPVRACSALSDRAAEEIAACDIMATAVGVNALPKIAEGIARGLSLRMARGGRPLNVLICENQMHADAQMRAWISGHLSPEQIAWCDANLGLVEASIGRMVPAVPPEVRARDRLLSLVEPYCELPVDRDAFRGEIPDLAGLKPFSPFAFYIRRKLFLHNGGHALCAYLGFQKGYAFIAQAASDPEIREAVRAHMNACAQALIARFGEGVRENVEDNVEDLLRRFRNRALMDTVARVGADPIRKLRRDDRLVGAALFAIEQGVDPAPIVRGIAAALRFDCPGDRAAAELQMALRERGLEFVLQKYLGLSPEEPLFACLLRNC